MSKICNYYANNLHKNISVQKIIIIIKFFKNCNPLANYYNKFNYVYSSP